MLFYIQLYTACRKISKIIVSVFNNQMFNNQYVGYSVVYIFRVKTVLVLMYV